MESWNNSGENEWYTPPEYIAAAKAVAYLNHSDRARLLGGDKARVLVVTGSHRRFRGFPKVPLGLQPSSRSMRLIWRGSDGAPFGV